MADINVVCYPNISFGGKTIATTVRNSSAQFYWYEDFLEFTDKAEKKTYKDFGFKLK